MLEKYRQTTCEKKKYQQVVLRQLQSSYMYVQPECRSRFICFQRPFFLAGVRIQDRWLILVGSLP